MATTIDRPSRPIGATVGVFFGGLWCVLGSQVLPHAWQWPAIATGWIVTAALVVQLWRRKSVPGGGGAMFRQRAYLAAVILEVAALLAAANLLPQAGFGDQMIPAVGVIVGLHFIGLWMATGLRRFLGIAFAMCVVSVASAFLPTAYAGLDLRVAACGFANALVLWIGAGLAL
jgi:hypothetical protein